MLVGSLRVQILISVIKFYILYTDTLFLLSLIDLNNLGCYYNNLENRVYNKNYSKSIAIVRRYNYPFIV